MKIRLLFLLLILLCCMIPLTLTLGNSLLITYTPSTFQKLLLQNNDIFLSKRERTSLATSLHQGITQQKPFQVILDSGKPAFSEKEITHMIDVARLIKFLTFLFIILLALSIFLFIFLRKQNLQFFSFIPLVSVLLSIAMLTIILLNFDRMFTLFHELSFRNDFWLLDPTKDLLINLFPLSFFMIQFSKICLLTLFEIVLLYFGLRVLKK